MSKTEQQEIETIKSIQKNIQSLRDLFSKLLSDREEELLKQCHAIYQHRRARIQSHINDVLVNKTNSEEHQSTESSISNPPAGNGYVNADIVEQERLLHFLDCAPTVIVHNVFKILRSVLLF